MLDGKRLRSAFSNGYSNDIPNGPEYGKAKALHGWRFFIRDLIHSLPLSLLACPAVSVSVASSNS